MTSSLTFWIVIAGLLGIAAVVSSGLFVFGVVAPNWWGIFFGVMMAAVIWAFILPKIK